MTNTNEVPGGESELRQLRELAERREVCWDVFRERVAVRGAIRTVGYELVLSGIHTPAQHAPTPGCDLCKDVFSDLRTLARWILPKEHRPSIYEIKAYRPIIQHARRRSMRAEVTLCIKILHRHHYEDPIDQCETRCLTEMEQQLRRIGACQGGWKPRPPPGKIDRPGGPDRNRTA